MTKKEPGFSRRKVIASAGAIAAVGVAGVRPGFAEDDPGEVQNWQSMIGHVFKVGRIFCDDAMQTPNERQTTRR